MTKSPPPTLRSSRSYVRSFFILVLCLTSLGLQAQEILTVEKAIQMALESNFDVRISDNTTKRAEQDVKIADSEFQPSFGITTSDSFNTQVRSGDLLDGAAQPQSNNQVSRAIVSQDLNTGGNISLSTRLNRNFSNSTNSTINPRYVASTTLSLRQPLLSGYGPDVAKARRRLARLSLDQANLDFQATVLQVVNTVESSYHLLAFAQEQLNVRQAALDLANALFSENRTKMDTGIATSLDVLQAEVGVANATDRLLRAEKELEDAKDRLITVIGDESLREHPLIVEAPDVEDPIEPDVETTFNRVIENAPRYLTLLNQRYQREIELRRAKRNRLPSLNLNGDYSLTGLEGSLESAFDDVTEADSYNWQWSLSLDVPWGLNEKRANFIKAQIQLDTEDARAVREKQRLIRDTRIAVRDVITAIEGIGIRELATKLSIEEFEMEKAKFDAGLSTGRQVLEAQQRMDESRVDELQAKIDLLDAYSELRELNGASLERYGIEFE